MVHKFRFITIFILLMSLVIHIQCGKPNNPQPTTTQEDAGFIGEWQWVQASGGIAGTTRTPETEGYTETLELYLDSTYYMLRLSQTNTWGYEGSFTIKYDQTWNVNDSADVLTMNSMRSIIEIVGDTLFLSELCYDCFNVIYVKIK